MACGSRAAGIARRPRGQPRRSSHRHGLRGRQPDGAAHPSRSLDVANVATSFPGFPALARAPASRWRRSSDLTRMAAPVVTIDGPSGSGKGTVSRAAGARIGWHLLDSGALYRLVALGGALRGAGRRMMSPAHARARRAHAGAISQPMPVARSASCSTGSEVTRGAAHRRGRGGGVAGGRLAGGARGAAGAPARLRRAPRPDRRRARHGHRGVPAGAAQDLPDRKPPRNGPGDAITS